MSVGKIIPEFADKNRNYKYLTIDIVTITFLTFTGLLLVIFSGFKGINYFYFGTCNLLISGFILVFLKKGIIDSFKKGLFRILYPLVTIALVHVEVELFIEMIYGADPYLDHIVLKWDAALFGVNPHLYFQAQLPQLYWNEFFHLLYISYYPFLFGSLIWVWKKRRYDFPRFVFIYLGLFFTFVVIFSLFPVIGPLEIRDNLHVNPGVISRFVDFLFLIGAPDGAAFPSSHIGQSVGIYLLLHPMSKKSRILLGLMILGIALSMVYASIHYAIDAAAGFISGWIIYTILNAIYLKFINKE